jgi:branched-chain amino acid transport system substrate-binding protein
MIKKRHPLKYILLTGLIFLFSCNKYPDKIKIIVAGPFSGGIAEEIMRAATIAAADINAGGGIKHRKVFKTIKSYIQPVYVDTLYSDVSKARKELSDAIDKSAAKFMIGGFASKMVLSLMEIMAKKKIIWLGTGGASIKIPERIKNNYNKYKYYFKTSLINTREQARLIADFIKAKLIPAGFKRATIIAVSHGYAKEVISFVKLFLSEARVNFKYEFYFNPAKADFKKMLLKAKKTDFIVAAMVGNETVSFFKEIRKQNILKIMPVIGPFATSLTQDIYKKTKGNAKNLLFLSGCIDLLTRNASVSSFRARYYKEYGVFPNWMAYNTYDAFMLLKDIIEKTKSLKAKKIIALLESNSYEHYGFFRKKWYKETHDLVTGFVNGKLYSNLAIIQYRDGGEERCLYPESLQNGTLFLPARRR